MIFKGYISSGSLSDNSIVDQSIQNMVIRNSCEKRGLQYHLSATEYGISNCFLVLNQILKDLKKNKYEGVAFYSLAQLPLNFNKRKKIYEATVSRGKQILFSLENLLINNKEKIEDIEQIIQIQNLLKFCPKNFQIR